MVDRRPRSRAIVAPRARGSLRRARVERLRRQIAQLDRQSHARRESRSARSGSTSSCPTVPTWRPGARGHDLAHRERELRRGHQRVLPLGHRRRAGVVGEAGRRPRRTGRSRRCPRRRRSGCRPARACRPARCAARDSSGARPCGRTASIDAIGIAADASGCASARRHAVPHLIQVRRLSCRRRRCGCRRVPRPNATPSSCAQTTISSGWRVRDAGRPAAPRSRRAPPASRGRRRSCRRSAPSRCASRTGSAAATARVPARRREDVAGRIDARLESGARIRSIT